MLQLTSTNTLTFIARGDYWIDIVTYGSKRTEVYIYNINYGIKELMFGLNGNRLEIIMEIVENHLDENIEYYKKIYEDEKEES